MFGKNVGDVNKARRYKAKVRFSKAKALGFKVKDKNGL